MIRSRRLGVSYVDYDWGASFRQAVQTFCAHGHKRIAMCLSGWMSNGGGHAWRREFIMEAVAHGLDYPIIDYCRSSRDWQYVDFAVQQTEILLDMPQPPTAIYYKAPHHEMAPVFEVSRTGG